MSELPLAVEASLGVAFGSCRDKDDREVALSSAVRLALSSIVTARGRFAEVVAVATADRRVARARGFVAEPADRLLVSGKAVVRSLAFATDCGVTVGKVEAGSPEFAAVAETGPDCLGKLGWRAASAGAGGSVPLAFCGNAARAGVFGAGAELRATCRLSLELWSLCRGFVAAAVGRSIAWRGRSRGVRGAGIGCDSATGGSCCGS